MNKRILYILINCSRVLEGTLKNLLSYSAEVVSFSKEEINHPIFYKLDGPAGFTPDNTNTPENASTAVVIDAAKNDVALMPAETGSDAQSPEKKSKECIEPKPEFIRPIEPDCIIYQLSEDEDVDTKLVGHIRRMCAFRDVPVFVAAPYSDLPRAKKLLDEGADEVIMIPMNPVALQKKLLKALEPAGTRMPVITKVLNPYIGATIDLLSTKAGLKIEKKEVFLKKNYRLFGDISAIMTFTGKVEGEFVICFEEKLAREIVSRIMATPPENLTKDELYEGIGGIVDSIAGKAKASLAATEYTHQIALPTVVFGRSHELSHPGNAPCIVVNFKVEDQPMAVLVSMATKQ